MNDVCPHDLDGLLVLAALRNNQVGITLRRLDELFMHRLEDIAITVENHLCGAASLYRISLNNADKSLVWVSIDEDLQIHEVAQLLLPQGHNAFYDDDFARLDVDGFRQTIADEVAVSGLLDALPFSQSLDLLGKKLPVEGVRMVEIDATTLFWSEMSGVVVVRVLRYERHSICRKRFDNLLYNCCFARACASGYADDIHIILVLL